MSLSYTYPHSWTKKPIHTNAVFLAVPISLSLLRIIPWSHQTIFIAVPASFTSGEKVTQNNWMLSIENFLAHINVRRRRCLLLKICIQFLEIVHDLAPVGHLFKCTWISWLAHCVSLWMFNGDFLKLQYVNTGVLLPNSMSLAQNFFGIVKKSKKFPENFPHDAIKIPWGKILNILKLFQYVFYLYFGQNIILFSSKLTSLDKTIIIIIFIARQYII